MNRFGIFSSAMAVLIFVALLFITYYLSTKRDGETPQAFREVVHQRMESLAEMEERLTRLEEEILALRGASAADKAEGTDGRTKDADTRWTALQASVSTLQRRVEGLEADPVRRGYSFLESENAELRREGVNILTRVARYDADARAAIRELLTDPSARVREQASQRLGDLKDKESEPQMVVLLADTDARTRRRAIQALGAINAQGAARDIGQNLIADTDDRVRQEAADVLGRLKSRDAEEFLSKALTDRNEAVKGEAIASLAEIGATSAAPLLRALYDQDPGSHRLRLVSALKQLGDPEPLRREVSLLSELVQSDPDENRRSQAIRELAILDRDSSRAVFSRALEDPSPRVRREAERALR